MHLIHMNAPHKNALSTDLMRWLIAELDAAAEGPVLLTGEGDAFSAGLDLREVAALDIEGMATFLALLDLMMVRYYSHPAPIVAAVNGHAIAGGCVLMLCCDMRIATANPRTRIGLNEVALGVRFPPRILEMVRRRVSSGHVEEVLLGAALYAPQDALRVGLVDRVSEEPVAEAKRWIETVSAHPRATYAAAKRDLRGELVATEDDARRFRDELLPVWVSGEVRARMTGRLKG